MSKKDDFKEFASKNPSLAKYIENGEMSWQKFYELYDIYGLTEIYGPGIGINCEKEHGIHYWDDYIYIEIIDPATGEPVADGEPGEF